MEQEKRPLSEAELRDIELRTELFNRYILPNRNLVYRLCIRYTFLQENIADNYSEALVNFFRYITTYDPQRSLLNWIHIVTKRFVMEQNRRHGRLPVSENVDISKLASSLSDENETHGNAMGMDNYREFYNDDILAALDQLKPIYREALLLQQAGYKLEEIVEISYRNGNMKSRSMDTMKSRIFLAKQQMRKLITPDGEKR
ncbi:MAG: sigma-70 family RNA polymerase sigma factor [Alistipes senegalensis]|nr:sigma-70 family RNA polymerase sigma factor [Bacteroides cellulosilyticus]MCM1352827.1 sigma-70 family RNA polymerase sigma factor [Alistipes senegalensis]